MGSIKEVFLVQSIRPNLKGSFSHDVTDEAFNTHMEQEATLAAMIDVGPNIPLPTGLKGKAKKVQEERLTNVRMAARKKMRSYVDNHNRAEERLSGSEASLFVLELNENRLKRNPYVKEPKLVDEKIAAKRLKIVGQIRATLESNNNLPEELQDAHSDLVEKLRNIEPEQE